MSYAHNPHVMIIILSPPPLINNKFITYGSLSIFLRVCIIKFVQNFFSFNLYFSLHASNHNLHVVIEAIHVLD